MAKKFNIQEHVKQTLYTCVFTMGSTALFVSSYQLWINEYYGISIVVFSGAICILIIFSPLAYELAMNSKKRNIYSHATNRSIPSKSGLNSKKHSLGMSIPNLFRNGREVANSSSKTVSYIDHLDYLFCVEMDGCKKEFAGWILWKFLHIGEYLQIKIDDRYSGVAKKPPGAFSRKTWSDTRWDGRDWRYNFTWSQQNWAMVYRVLRDGCIKFSDATGIIIATGLGEGETLRLSRGAGYVYECIATALLPQWDWLRQIRNTPKLVGTGRSRSGQVNRSK